MSVSVERDLATTSSRVCRRPVTRSTWAGPRTKWASPPKFMSSSLTAPPSPPACRATSSPLKTTLSTRSSLGRKADVNSAGQQRGVGGTKLVWPPAAQCFEAFALIAPLIESLTKVFGQSVNIKSSALPVICPPHLAVSAEPPSAEAVRNVKEVCTEMSRVLVLLLRQLEDIGDAGSGLPSNNLDSNPRPKSCSGGSSGRKRDLTLHAGDGDIGDSSIAPELGDVALDRTDPLPTGSPTAAEPVLFTSEFLHAQANQFELEAAAMRDLAAAQANVGTQMSGEDNAMTLTMTSTTSGSGAADTRVNGCLSPSSKLLEAQAAQLEVEAAELRMTAANAQRHASRVCSYPPSVSRRAQAPTEVQRQPQTQEGGSTRATTPWGRRR